MMTVRPFLQFWLLIFMALASRAQLVRSQESPSLAPATQTTAQVTDPPVDARRQQRDGLWQDANRLRSERKYDEAAVLGEKMLAIERDWLGENNRRILVSMEWLADVYQVAEDLPNFKQKLQDILNWRSAQQGEEHWETKLAKLRQLDTQLLSLEQLRQVSEADRLSSEVDRLRRAGSIVEAGTLAQQVSDLRRDVFGEKSLPYAHSLNSLGFLYSSMKDYTRAEPFYLQALEIRKVVLGESHPFYATSLFNLGFLYSSMKDYTRAEPFYLQALEIRKKALGETHPDHAMSLNNLGFLYSSMKQYTRAEPYYLQALEIRKKVLGEAHPDYAASLNQLGVLYSRMKDYDRAEPYYLQALEIRKNIPGEAHADFARTLSNLGAMYMDMKDFARAEPLLLQTLEIRKKFQGEVHPDYTFSLIDLGVLYSSMSDYARAEPYDLQALEIRKKVLGEAHPDYAGSLHRLGVLYSSMKDYNHAEPYYLQALEIRKKVLGEDHPDCATSLNNLGMLYLEMKDFAQAEPFLRQAMEIRKKILGETHPDYATSLNNLGMLYWSMGDFQRAEPLFLKSMEIIRKAYGEEDVDYLTCLNNVGSLYSSMKNYAGAEPYLLQSMKIMRKKLGEKDPEYARSLSNLGRLYLGMNEFARAEPYFLQAVEIWRDVLGHQHPDYPMGLYNLGTLYSWMGDDVRAEPLLRQALEIWQKTIGEDHINLALAHHSLGIVLFALNRTSDAESELQQSARIGLAHLQQTFAVQTERQRLILLEQVRVELDSWLAVAPAAAVEPAAMYDRLLLWKGIIFVEQQRQQLLRSDPKLADVFRELESVTRQLAAASFAVPTSERERQQREQQIAILTEDKERIERQLAQQSAAYRQQQRTIQATSQGHFSNLPRNAALVDFLVYADSAPAIEGTTSREFEKRLMAFVIRSNTSIQRFDLGPVAPMTELIDDWRKQARYPVGLLGEDHPGVALRKLIWEPLETSLVGAETVLISPDGPLCRFPFAALPGTRSDTFLIEERAVAVIPVPQLLPQLLASTATDEAHVTSNESLLLVGAVEYGGSPGVIGEARGGETAVSLDELERSAALPTYGPLIETRAEIDQLQESFKAQFPNQPIALLDGTQATEAAFRQQISGYRWLHLATHGFFAPARLKSVLAPTAEERSLQPGEFERATASGFNPGLLSGIVLTGANTEPAAGEDDGILTALEVAALDLSKVDLAVLSACETGLGEEAGGEGVLGLQRAFQLAGARTVVSSLWRVPDRQTSLLMQRFYHNVWQGKMSRIEALREAQIWILRGGDEVERAEVPPSQWAAFVLSGDWR